MELPSFHDLPFDSFQRVLALLTVTRSMPDHLIWRLDLSQMMSLITRLASTLLPAWLPLAPQSPTFQVQWMSGPDFSFSSL